MAGLHPVAARGEQPQAQSGVQLAVHPLAARALLGCRSAELLGPGDHGHEVLGRAAVELHERVGSRSRGADRLDVVQQWIRDRVDQAPRSSVRPDQAHLTREFRQMAGCTPTQWLAQERRNIQDGGHRHRPD